MIEATGLCKSFPAGEAVVEAVRDASLTVAVGEAVAIVGASGSGKSTLVSLLGCLDVPTSGTYRLSGTDVGLVSRGELAAFRNRHIGFVFQSFNLLARASALENVELPLVYAGLGARERRRRAWAMLEAVGLGDRAGHRPAQLSGGQQQRVAIARALVTRPRLLLADEPTGSVDTETGTAIMQLLLAACAEGVTLLLITHDPGIAGMLPRAVTMRDGRLVGDSGRPRASGESDDEAASRACGRARLVAAR
jgi:putative ABC transport system ATP-binding protein